MGKELLIHRRTACDRLPHLGSKAPHLYEQALLAEGDDDRSKRRMLYKELKVPCSGEVGGPFVKLIPWEGFEF